MNREQLLHLDNMIGAQVRVTEPGEVHLDIDGVPTAVDPAQEFDAELFTVTVTEAELHRAGLTRDDVPNLRVVTDQIGAQHDD